METVSKQIERKLNRSRKSRFFFLSDFRGIASDGAVKMTLSRLCKLGKVKRIAQGIYRFGLSGSGADKGRADSKAILPTTDDIIEAIAIKEHIRIKPTGAAAFFKLGLTQKSPENLVYLTDGSARKFRLGNAEVVFKATTSKKLSGRGAISSLVILALDELGMEHMDEGMQKKIRILLDKEDPRILLDDMRLAPVKVSDFLFQLMR